MGVTLIGAARPCDYCKSAAALLFCRADAAFTCLSCDADLHAAGNNHGRVWVCDACERAPAAVTCRADAAALCAACDGDIHSANPLARRHDRAPVIPFYGDAAEALLMKSSAVCPARDDDDVIPGGWVSPDPVVNTDKIIPVDVIKPEFFFVDSDHQFLDFDTYQMIGSQPYADSLVPVQTTIKPAVQDQLLTHQHSPENRFEIDFTRSNINFYSNSAYTAPSLSHSVSSSSLDVGIVPDGSALSETSYPFGRTMSSIDLTAHQASQAVGMDREARVLRYKEKRKNRKFEKTIRYASRKAYAETRPRIKGRFAKRTDSEPDLYGIFGSDGGDFIADARYGIVPFF